ncbi:hypothetical protein C1646_775287 [Rhizophagus diaphanus]|nr:hypothetical protein C1646_775287 [Rhizophagus diaphanus] [Rhizophagus sp. MUCL 43196]
MSLKRTTLTALMLVIIKKLALSIFIGLKKSGMLELTRAHTCILQTAEKKLNSETISPNTKIRQRKLEREASSADEAAIANTLLLLRERYSNYPLERIYNIDEMGLFYSLLLQYVEAGNHIKDLYMNILQAIHFIIQVWGKINPKVVRNLLDKFMNALQDFNLLYPMQVEEFLNLPKENIVYKVSENDKIIEELIYLFKNTDKENMDLEEIDNRVKQDSKTNRAEKEVSPIWRAEAERILWKWYKEAEEAYKQAVNICKKAERAFWRDCASGGINLDKLSDKIKKLIQEGHTRFGEMAVIEQAIFHYSFISEETNKGEYIQMIHNFELLKDGDIPDKDVFKEPKKFTRYQHIKQEEYENEICQIREAQVVITNEEITRMMQIDPDPHYEVIFERHDQIRIGKELTDSNFMADIAIGTSGEHDYALFLTAHSQTIQNILQDERN